jgi:cell division protein FtsZ
MGIGIASGENRAVEAAEKAISHPLLEDISISGAKGVLMNITSSSDLTLDEMTEASDRIHQEVGDDAEIIWGQTFDDTLGDEIRITVIATGIGMEEPQLAENMHRFDPKAQAAAQMTASQPAFSQQTYSGAMEAAMPAAPPHTRGTSHSREPIVRGQVRTPTQEELANWNEFDNPVRVTQRRVVGDENMVNDYPPMAFDHDDLEVPTFLRRKAD